MIPYLIRMATATDAAVIAGHRVAMFRDMGRVPTQALGLELKAQSTPMLAALLDDGAYVGWLAIAGDGLVIAGAGVHIKAQLPRIAPDGLRIELAPVPLVVNVYTEPGYRRQGVSRALMQTIQRWSTERRYDRVVLHASDAGRPLYRAIGFDASNEMIWIPSSGASSERTASTSITPRGAASDISRR